MPSRRSQTLHQHGQNLGVAVPVDEYPPPVELRPPPECGVSAMWSVMAVSADSSLATRSGRKASGAGVAEHAEMRLLAGSKPSEIHGAVGHELGIGGETELAARRDVVASCTPNLLANSLEVPIASVARRLQQFRDQPLFRRGQAAGPPPARVPQPTCEGQPLI